MKAVIRKRKRARGIGERGNEKATWNDRKFMIKQYYRILRKERSVCWRFLINQDACFYHNFVLTGRELVMYRRIKDL